MSNPRSSSASSSNPELKPEAMDVDDEVEALPPTEHTFKSNNNSSGQLAGTKRIASGGGKPAKKSKVVFHGTPTPVSMSVPAQGNNSQAAAPAQPMQLEGFGFGAGQAPTPNRAVPSSLGQGTHRQAAAPNPLMLPQKESKEIEKEIEIEKAYFFGFMMLDIYEKIECREKRLKPVNIALGYLDMASGSRRKFNSEWRMACLGIASQPALQNFKGVDSRDEKFEKIKIWLIAGWPPHLLPDFSKESVEEALARVRKEEVMTL